MYRLCILPWTGRPSRFPLPSLPHSMGEGRGEGRDELGRAIGVGEEEPPAAREEMERRGRIVLEPAGNES